MRGPMEGSHDVPGAARLTPQRSFADDPLGVALLPVLLHRMRNVTQRLVNLKCLSELGDATRVMGEWAGDDLALAGEETSAIGWLLAILAGGAGTDVLLARREPAGLGTFIDLVQEGVRRAERELAAPEVPLPKLTPAVGWELCWSLGSVLFAAATGRPRGTTTAWRLALEPAGGEAQRWRLVLPDRGDIAPDSLASARGACARLEASAIGKQLAFETRPEAWILSFPGSWLLVDESA